MASQDAEPGADPSQPMLEPYGIPNPVMRQDVIGVADRIITDGRKEKLDEGFGDERAAVGQDKHSEYWRNVTLVSTLG